MTPVISFIKYRALGKTDFGFIRVRIGNLKAGHLTSVTLIVNGFPYIYFIHPSTNEVYLPVVFAPLPVGTVMVTVRVRDLETGEMAVKSFSFKARSLASLSSKQVCEKLCRNWKLMAETAEDISPNYQLYLQAYQTCVKNCVSGMDFYEADHEAFKVVASTANRYYFNPTTSPTGQVVDKGKTKTKSQYDIDKQLKKLAEVIAKQFQYRLPEIKLKYEARSSGNILEDQGRKSSEPPPQFVKLYMQDAQKIALLSDQEKLNYLKNWDADYVIHLPIGSTVVNKSEWDYYFSDSLGLFSNYIQRKLKELDELIASETDPRKRAAYKLKRRELLNWATTYLAAARDALAWAMIMKKPADPVAKAWHDYESKWEDELLSLPQTHPREFFKPSAKSNIVQIATPNYVVKWPLAMYVQIKETLKRYLKDMGLPTDEATLNKVITAVADFWMKNGRLPTSDELSKIINEAVKAPSPKGSSSATVTLVKGHESVPVPFEITVPSATSEEDYWDEIIKNWKRIETGWASPIPTRPTLTWIGFGIAIALGVVGLIALVRKWK